MASQQLYTVGFLAAHNRVPVAVVESLIRTAGIEPRIVLNQQRQFDNADLNPVYAGMVAYIKGVPVTELTTEAGANA